MVSGKAGGKQGAVPPIQNSVHHQKPSLKQPRAAMPHPAACGPATSPASLETYRSVAAAASACNSSGSRATAHALSRCSARSTAYGVAKSSG